MFNACALAPAARASARREIAWSPRRASHRGAAGRGAPKKEERARTNVQITIETFLPCTAWVGLIRKGTAACITTFRRFRACWSSRAAARQARGWTGTGAARLACRVGSSSGERTSVSRPRKRRSAWPRLPRGAARMRAPNWRSRSRPLMLIRGHRPPPRVFQASTIHLIKTRAEPAPAAQGAARCWEDGRGAVALDTAAPDGNEPPANAGGGGAGRHGH